MISDKELGKALFDAAWETGPAPHLLAGRVPWDGMTDSGRAIWTQMSRRARELLLPPEAQAVLTEAGRMVDDVHLLNNNQYSRLEDAVRAYRAAQPPQERTLIFPDASGHAIKETDYPDLMAMLKEWRQKRESK